MLGLSHCGTHSGEGGGVHQHDELPVEHVQRGVLVGRNPLAHVAAVHLHEHAGHRLNQRGGHAPMRLVEAAWNCPYGTD
jgi:hypothetical protein